MWLWWTASCERFGWKVARDWMGMWWTECKGFGWKVMRGCLTQYEASDQQCKTLMNSYRLQIDFAQNVSYLKTRSVTLSLQTNRKFHPQFTKTKWSTIFYLKKKSLYKTASLIIICTAIFNSSFTAIFNLKDCTHYHVQLSSNAQLPVKFNCGWSKDACKSNITDCHCTSMPKITSILGHVNLCLHVVFSFRALRDICCMFLFISDEHPAQQWTIQDT